MPLKAQRVRGVCVFSQVWSENKAVLFLPSLFGDVSVWVVAGPPFLSITLYLKSIPHVAGIFSQLLWYMNNFFNERAGIKKLQ